MIRVNRNFKAGLAEHGHACTVRILLADDSPEILERVSALLHQQQHDVIAAVSDPDRIAAEVEKTKPQLIVLDISMGPVSGIDVARKLFSRGFVGKIVFLTVHEDPDFISAAIAAGGSGYVVKGRLGNDLVPAIECVMADKVFISSPAARR